MGWVFEVFLMNKLKMNSRLWYIGREKRAESERRLTVWGEAWHGW